MRTKRCPRCGIVKLAEEFYLSRNTKNGLASYCKECSNEYCTSRERVIIPTKVVDPYEADNNTKDYKRKKYHTDPQFRVAHMFRVRLGLLIRGRGHHPSLLDDCSVSEHKEIIDHLVSTIPKGYTLADYGKGGLCVDHINPCCNYNLTNSVSRKQCFNIHNIRLVHERVNWAKGIN